MEKKVNLSPRKQKTVPRVSSPKNTFVNSVNQTLFVNDGELIFGLVGAVGTDTSDVIKFLHQRLTVAHYVVTAIDIAEEIIPDIIYDLDESKQAKKGSPSYQRTYNMMSAGDEARRRFGEDVLANAVAGCISARRNEVRGKTLPLQRHAFIIKSLKHPKEALRLREIYPQGFYLIGVHARDDRRLTFLTDHKRMEVQEAQELINRDKGEKEQFGQHVTATFHLSDFFVQVDGYTDQLKNSIWRIVDILFNRPCVTPTFHEYAMFLAFSASLRSADLSRQVGAVVTKDPEILSLGVNDCPKAGGGLYSPEFDGKQKCFVDVENGRDYKRKGDSNKHEQDDIIANILKKLEESKIDANIVEKIRGALKSSRIMDITEYGRAVHAEMEALLACARNAVSTVGAVIYCTTFPCHNCAKHIIAAGIRKVVYIEPYPKSKTAELHDDAIVIGLTPENAPGDTTTNANVQSHQGTALHVRFEPFVGVGPRRFFDLFSMKLGSGAQQQRKDANGQVISWRLENANARLQMLSDSYLELEVKAQLQYGACGAKKRLRND